MKHPQDKSILIERKNVDQNYKIVEFQSQEIPEIQIGINMDSRIVRLSKFSGNKNQLDDRTSLLSICKSESLS